MPVKGCTAKTASLLSGVATPTFGAWSRSIRERTYPSLFPSQDDEKARLLMGLPQYAPNHEEGRLPFGEGALRMRASSIPGP